MNKRRIHIDLGETVLKIAFIVTLLFGLSAGLFSQSAEYMMKAVALEKISLFISWPANSLNNDTSQEFVIGVLRQSTFREILENVYKDKKIKDKKVRIVNMTNMQELARCQLLFIPSMKTSELQKLLNYIKGKPILTVSDTEGFAEAGCFVNFYQFENKLRFEINQKGLKDTGFNVDYRLLKVSKVLNPIIE